MLIRQLANEELEQLSTIDALVNLNPWSLADYLGLAPHQQAWGIFTGPNKLAGGCVYSQVLDQGEILQLCITRANQRQGLARQILTAVCAQMQQNSVSEIFLEVRIDNLAAIKLYQALGFNQISIRKNYYFINQRRFDAILMVKTICL